MKGLRPSVTPAQVVAVLLAGIPMVANLLRSFSLYDVTPLQQAALNEAVQWGGIFAGLLVLGDAGLRSARNHADARVSAATAQASAVVASLSVPVPAASSGSGIVFSGGAMGAGSPPARDPETGLAESAEPVDPEAEAVPADALPDDDTELSDPVARAIAEEVQQGRS